MPSVSRPERLIELRPLQIRDTDGRGGRRQTACAPPMAPRRTPPRSAASARRRAAGNLKPIQHRRVAWRAPARPASIRSSRVVAKKRPLGMAPRQWPARPTRCMPDSNRARRPDLANQIDRCRYRCPVPATPWRRACESRRSSAVSPRQDAACAKGSRDGGHILRADALTDGMREPLDHRRVLTNTSVERCSCASAARRS